MNGGVSPDPGGATPEADRSEEKPAGSPLPFQRGPAVPACARGDAALLALAWTVVLLAGMVGIVLGAGPAWGSDALAARAAARTLALIAACGIVIIWPMLRLSQRVPTRPLRATLVDTVAALLPVQAVLWPQTLPWLARWPIEVVAALAGLLAGWGVLTGGALAWVQTQRQAGHLRPATGMAIFLALGLLGAVPVMITRGPEIAGMSGTCLSWMVSPVTGVLELTRDRSHTGRSAALTATHLQALGATWVAAAGAWMAAAWASVVHPREPRMTCSADAD